MAIDLPAIGEANWGTKLNAALTELNGVGVVAVAAKDAAVAAAASVPSDATIAATYATKVSPAFSGTPTGLTKAHVGLSNVDNTSDVNKPVSTAQATAIALKVSTSLVGANSGVAPLDSSGKVPSANLPTAATASVLTPGTYAARPTASSAGANTLYYATDVPECYLSNGTSWSVVGSGGSELAVAVVTTTSLAQGPAFANMPGMTITFKVGERPIYLEFEAVGSVATSGIYAYGKVLLDGVDAGSVSPVTSVASQIVNLRRQVRVSGLTPGSTHTVTVQIATVSGTITPQSSTTNPSYLRAVTA